MLRPFSFAFFLLLGTCWWSACGSDTNTGAQNTLKIDLDNAVVQQIIGLRSKRLANNRADIETLRTYLAVENPLHRYIAALVLASVQDSAISPDLSKLLYDEYVEIRQIAAFALGQTKGIEAASALADSALFRLDTNRMVQATILEAIGRCGNEDHLKHLISARTYSLKDSLLSQGQALGIYRFAMRGMVHPEGTSKIMNDFIANAAQASSVRFIAANYLARAPRLDLSNPTQAQYLINAVRNEKDVNTLMFLVIGLAKIKTNEALLLLKEKYAQAQDYRVRCNIIRGFRYFPHDSTKALVTEALFDSTHPHIALVAAEHFYLTGKDFDALQYVNWAKVHPLWQVRVQLQAAALKNLAAYKTPNKTLISQKLIEQYQQTNNLYEKSAILRALSNFEWNYRFLLKEVLPVADSIVVPPVIQSSATEALVTIRQSPDFARVFGLNKVRVQDELNVAFRQLIERGDVGVLAILAELLVNPDLNFKLAFPDYQFLVDAQNKLSLPRDVETFLALQKTIDYFANSQTSVQNKLKNNFVEIDWQMLKALGDKPQATLTTSRGNIVLELYPQQAPATVTQFVQLAKAGFYNNKTFHRVVPNFVAQAGCPRGDGWGGFQVAIPSEFSTLHYWNEGMVGMASAGKDTESTQFFITHSPTIHLDGNYTVFGKVVSGMDIVHNLQVGDSILTIQITK